MIYPEFEQFESFVDPLNPYCNAYKTKEGHIFYVEPGFYSGMQGFKEKREERYQDLLNGIFDVIKKNEKVIFTWSYDSPFMEKDGFIYREISDISDPLKIYVEDKSRGSDYGDQQKDKKKTLVQIETRAFRIHVIKLVDEDFSSTSK